MTTFYISLGARGSHLEPFGTSSPPFSRAPVYAGALCIVVYTFEMWYTSRNCATLGYVWARSDVHELNVTETMLNVVDL
jgi:hypothetical protein